MPQAAPCCCLPCSGMGKPSFTDWKVDRGGWAAGESYVVEDLVWHGTPPAYYICKTAHTAIETTVTPPVTGNDPPNATYWTVGDRALKCLYLEIANLGFKGCMPLIGIEDGEDETSTKARVRLDEFSIDVKDKWLIRQRKPSTDENGFQNKLLYLFGGSVGRGCWWQFHCDCDANIYTEVITVKTAVGLKTTYTDSYSSGFTIQIAFTETEVEVVVFGGLFPFSSGADGDHDPVAGQDIPCQHPTLWMSVGIELFRGTANIPGNWIDEYGTATSTITINNNWSCADIGTILQEGVVPTDGYRPLGRFIVGAGGGTIKLTPPHAADWQDSIGNAAANCGSFADCDGTGGEDPPWNPAPPPPYPSPPGGGGGGDDPLPPPPPGKKGRYSPVNKCSGGRFGQWVETGSYPPGTVLLVTSKTGSLVCVVVSGDVKLAEAMPGPRLSGVLENLGARACSECSACFRLERCDGLVNLFTRDDLSAVVGKIVRVGGECFEVFEAENCASESHPSIGEEFETCEDCDPVCCECGDCEFSSASEVEWYDEVTTTYYPFPGDFCNQSSIGSLTVTTSGTLTPTAGYCGLYQGECTVTFSDGRPDETADVGWWFSCSAGYWDPHPGSLFDEFCIPGAFADYQDCNGFDLSGDESVCGCYQGLYEGETAYIGKTRHWSLEITKNEACE